MRTPTTLGFGLLTAVMMIASVSAAPPSVTLPVDPLSVNIGPFGGAVEGEDVSNTHTYQNAPSGATCVALAQPYLVNVQSTGPVIVEVAGQTRTIEGSGSFSFTRGVCTTFDITVTGTGSLAAYGIEVLGGPLAGSVALGSVIA